MITEHRARNWINLLQLSVHTPTTEGLMLCFSKQHPLDVRVPAFEHEWQHWDDLQASLVAYCANKRPGDMNLKAVGSPPDDLINEGDDTIILWSSHLKVPEITQPLLFNFRATLIMEDNRVVATALICDLSHHIE